MANTEKTPDVKSEEQVKEPKKITIELTTQFVNNYSEAEGGVKVYGPGRVEVEEDLADDLLRRQREYLQSESDRINGTDRSRGLIGEVR